LLRRRLSVLAYAVSFARAVAIAGNPTRSMLLAHDGRAAALCLTLLLLAVAASQAEQAYSAAALLQRLCRTLSGVCASAAQCELQDSCCIVCAPLLVLC
jgi:hypothetical protein